LGSPYPIQPQRPTNSGDDMTKTRDLHKSWMKKAAYRKEYETLEEEFCIMAAIARATGFRRLRKKNDVIPRRREASSPESTTTIWGYGFRTRAKRARSGMTAEFFSPANTKRARLAPRPSVS
jgi:hypothetical protein